MDKIIFAFFFLCISPSFLQGQEPLQLSSILERALMNNPTVDAAKERILAAELRQEQIGGLEDPSVRVLRHTQPFSEDSSFSPRTRYEIFQKIPISGKLSLERSIGKERIARLENEKELVTRELTFAVKKLFFSLCLVDFSLHAEEKIQKTLLPPPTSMQEEVEAAALQGRILQKQGEKKELILALSNLIGVSYESLSSKVLFSPSAQVDFSIEELEEKAFTNNPVTSSIKSHIEEQLFAKELAKRASIPDLTFSGRFDHRIGTDDTSWGISIGTRLPLWGPWKNHKEMKRAMALARAYKKDLAGEKSLLRRQISEVLSKIESLKQRIHLLNKEILPKAAALAKKGNTGDFFQQRQYESFLLEEKKLEIEREILLAELEKITGLSL